MAYQRVTLAQLKTRLRERLAEFDAFWPESELEAAINEAVAVWQLLTADYPAKEDVVLAAPSTCIVTPTVTTPMATLLRVRCKKTVGGTYGKAAPRLSLFDLDKGFYKWRAETVADCPDHWAPMGIDTFAIYPRPTVSTTYELLFVSGDTRLVNTTDYLQMGDEEIPYLISYAQWILAFKEGLKEAVENLDPFKKLFIQAAQTRNAMLRATGIYQNFLGEQQDETAPSDEATKQLGARS